MTSLEAVRDLDRTDPLSALRRAFVLPPSTIYLDGNSLGALPNKAVAQVTEVMTREWGQDLIRSWNTHQWLDLPLRVGDRIGRLIGAAPGQVVAADSVSVNLMKMISAALPLRPDRHVILTDSGNFPNDLYIAQGIISMLGKRHELRIVAPEEVEASIDDTVALTMLTEVDYRTGRRHDMRRLTRRAHEAGAIALWDLCHSAGALPIDLDGCDVDLAVGCGYKYLNGGPGAPAFLYVVRRLQSEIRPVLSGWLGHEQPFAFDLDYRPASGIARNLAGTPSILGLTVLNTALDVMLSVAMTEIRQKSLALSDLFIRLADERLAGHEITLLTPRDPEMRGSQVSLRHANGYAIVQALIAAGVVGDFRAPNIMRFGLAPLYTSYEDVWRAVDVLVLVMNEQRWRNPTFQQRSAVT